MSRASWAASAARPAAKGREPRPAGSWGAAIDRARRTWDTLRGGPPADGVYSEQAAAAIMAAAVALWADVVASMASGE